MTDMKTPAQVADEIASLPEFASLTEEDLGLTVEAMMILAVQADRAQRQPEIYIVQNDLGDVVDVFRDADEATAAYQDETYSVVEETVWEPGEYAAAQPPKCDECDEPAVNFWPKLVEPVQMCASCTHNARRSGWEPGQ